MKREEIIIAGSAVVLLVVFCIGMYRAGVTPEVAQKISYGINGLTETRCIDGYKFIVGEGGQARQILDGEGRGVRCQ